MGGRAAEENNRKKPLLSWGLFAGLLGVIVVLVVIILGMLNSKEHPTVQKIVAAVPPVPQAAGETPVLLAPSAGPLEQTVRTNLGDIHNALQALS